MRTLGDRKQTFISYLYQELKGAKAAFEAAITEPTRDYHRGNIVALEAVIAKYKETGGK